MREEEEIGGWGKEGMRGKEETRRERCKIGRGREKGKHFEVQKQKWRGGRDKGERGKRREARDEFSLTLSIVIL